MRAVTLAGFFFLAAGVLGQPTDDTRVRAAIAEFQSGNYRKRQAATEWLKNHPEAARALRDALKSADAEAKSRAKSILDYYDARPLRDLKASIKEGRIDHFIEVLSAWPEGKYESDAWAQIVGLAAKLGDLYTKKMGKKLKPLDSRYSQWLPGVTTGRVVTEKTERNDDLDTYVRAGEVDVDLDRNARGRQRFDIMSVNVLVAARTIRTWARGDHQFILAGGSVELIKGSGLGNGILVSGGDVIIRCDIGFALVVARGSITCTHRVSENSYLIAGKSVSLDYESDHVVISENDANPLGYIRWSDPPKDKAAGGKK